MEFMNGGIRFKEEIADVVTEFKYVLEVSKGGIIEIRFKQLDDNFPEFYCIFDWSWESAESMRLKEKESDLLEKINETYRKWSGDMQMEDFFEEVRKALRESIKADFDEMRIKKWNDGTGAAELEFRGIHLSPEVEEYLAKKMKEEEEYRTLKKKEEEEARTLEWIKTKLEIINGNSQIQIKDISYSGEEVIQGTTTRTFKAFVTIKDENVGEITILERNQNQIIVIRRYIAKSDYDGQISKLKKILKYIRCNYPDAEIKYSNAESGLIVMDREIFEDKYIFYVWSDNHYRAEVAKWHTS